MDCKKLPFKIISKTFQTSCLVFIFMMSMSVSAQDCPSSYPYLEAINGNVLSGGLSIQENETVGNVEDQSYIMFSAQDLRCADGINISVAAKSARGHIEVRLGSLSSANIGVSPVPNNNDWNDFVTILADIDSSGATGSDDVYFVFVSEPENESRYLFNIDAFQFTNSQPLSVKDEEVLNVSVYPNPTSALLSVNLERNNLNITQTKVSLFNIAGQRVLETAPSSSKFELNISELSSGLYILNVKDNAKNISKRIIKI